MTGYAEILSTKPVWLHPALSPHVIVAQFAPGNDLRGFGISRFNFHELNRIGG